MHFKIGSIGKAGIRERVVGIPASRKIPRAGDKYIESPHLS